MPRIRKQRQNEGTLTMTEPDKAIVYFSIDQNSEGQIQLAINYRGHGYRICGPKYDGRGRTIKKHKLTMSDVNEIRSYLDIVEGKEP